MRLCSLSFLERKRDKIEKAPSASGDLGTNERQFEIAILRPNEELRVWEFIRSPSADRLLALKTGVLSSSLPLGLPPYCPYRRHLCCIVVVNRCLQIGRVRRLRTGQALHPRTSKCALYCSVHCNVLSCSMMFCMFCTTSLGSCQHACRASPRPTLSREYSSPLVRRVTGTARVTQAELLRSRKKT